MAHVDDRHLDDRHLDGRHLNKGVLRRMVDAPFQASGGEETANYLLSTADRAHYAGCAYCRSKYARIEANARIAATLAGPLPPVDATLALARFRQRLAAQAAAGNLHWYERIISNVKTNFQMNQNRLLKPLGAVALVVLLIGALAFTPLGSYAESLLTLFTPKQFVAIPVTQDQIRTLPDLSDYGTMSDPPRPQVQHFTDAGAAAAAAGIAVLTPATLPAGNTGPVDFMVQSGATGSFTFSAAKAAAAAAARGETLPPMPANIDGSTLVVTTNPVVVATYGDSGISFSVAEQMVEPGDSREQNGKSSTSKQGTGSAAEHNIPNASKEMGSLQNGNIPQVVVVQSKAPTVSSTGVTVAELQQYLLNQPGISPELTAAIMGIADPSSTLPIPIPAGQANSHTVQVQGVNGLAIGDSTGLGSGVIWQKNGIVYAVGGPLTENEVLTIANSLH
ncbi:MAG: hypothetical protein HY326_05775 [Chloroflexi bacterium]|nr:hypothetical protein [Chloroflexota bacterium]